MKRIYKILVQKKGRRIRQPRVLDCSDYLQPIRAGNCPCFDFNAVWTA